MSICLDYTNYIFYLLGVSCPFEGKRRRGQQRMRLLDSITNSMDSNLSKPWEIVKDRSLAGYSPWGRKESDMTY